MYIVTPLVGQTYSIAAVSFHGDATVTVSIYCGGVLRIAPTNSLSTHQLWHAVDVVSVSMCIPCPRPPLHIDLLYHHLCHFEPLRTQPQPHMRNCMALLMPPRPHPPIVLTESATTSADKVWYRGRLASQWRTASPLLTSLLLTLTCVLSVSWHCESSLIILLIFGTLDVQRRQQLQDCPSLRGLSKLTAADRPDSATAVA